MDTKVFKEKVANILLKWTKVSEDKTHVRGRSDAIDDIMKSIIEPLLERINLQVKVNDDLLLKLRGYQELVKALEELDKLPLSDEILDKELELRQRINELRKQIE